MGQGVSVCICVCVCVRGYKVQHQLTAARISVETSLPTVLCYIGLTAIIKLQYSGSLIYSVIQLFLATLKLPERLQLVIKTPFSVYLSVIHRLSEFSNNQLHFLDVSRHNTFMQTSHALALRTNHTSVHSVIAV